MARRMFPGFYSLMCSYLSIFVTSELAGTNSKLWRIRTEMLDWHVRQPIVLLKGVSTFTDASYKLFPSGHSPLLFGFLEWEQLLLADLLVLLCFRFCGRKAKTYIFLFHHHSSIIINFTGNLGRDFRYLFIYLIYIPPIWYILPLWVASKMTYKH